MLGGAWAPVVKKKNVKTRQVILLSQDGEPLS